MRISDVFTCICFALVNFDIVLAAYRSSSSTYRSYRSSRSSSLYSSYRGLYKSSSLSRSYRSSSPYRSYSIPFRSFSLVQKRNAAMLGTIYIAYRLRARYGAGLGWDSDVNVCRNSAKYSSYNGTSSQYGWFLCPTDSVPYSYNECCGTDGDQRCCESWSSRNRVTVYIVIGSLFGIGCLGVVIFMLFYMMHRKKVRTRAIHVSNTHVVATPSYPMATQKTVDQPPSYSVAMTSSAPPTYPPAPIYPSTNAAYPPPNPHPAPYPAQPAPYLAQPAPYPAHPAPFAAPPSYPKSAFN